jgi:hypothetical protein
VKKAIEKMEGARAALDRTASWMKVLESISTAAKLINEVLEELKAPPNWETPEQWEKRTGKAWPDNGAVRILNPEDEWELMEYWRAKQLEQDLARLDKDFGDEPEGLIIVCDRGEAGPPPKDWRPEEEKSK